MTISDDIKKKFHDMMKEHYRTEPRVAFIGDTAEVPDAKIKPQPPQTPEPALLRIGADTYDAVVAEVGFNDVCFNLLMTTFNGMPIERVHPDDIEAPGWHLLGEGETPAPSYKQMREEYERLQDAGEHQKAYEFRKAWFRDHGDDK